MPLRTVVPARVGGVDLSNLNTRRTPRQAVPARVGGVDLSWYKDFDGMAMKSPRPCGRGGFKHLIIKNSREIQRSPPVWAGWI